MISLEQIVECRKCSLASPDVALPMLGKKSGIDMFIVLDHPQQLDAILQKPLQERSGLIVRKLLYMSGIDVNDCFVTYLTRCGQPTKPSKECKQWLLDEIKTFKPKVVLALGGETFKSLGGKVKVGDVARIDSIDSVLACWHAPHKLSIQGKKGDEESISFFKQVKVLADS